MLIVVIIIGISILVDKSPASLLAGLGAFAAVLMLVFKDSILGVVAGVQLSGNDALHVGDWIKVSGTDANGIVQESNTRRIMRSWMIDADSIVPMDDPLRKQIAALPLMADYFNGEDTPATSFVTTLSQTPSGIPLQVYCFTNTSKWVDYEHIQAEVFEHLATVMDCFNLYTFEGASGRDTIIDGYFSLKAYLPSLPIKLHLSVFSFPIINLFDCNCRNKVSIQGMIGKCRLVGPEPVDFFFRQTGGLADKFCIHS